jgi:hypothetical protein
MKGNEETPMIRQGNTQRSSQGVEVQLSGARLTVARVVCACVTLLSLIMWLWGLPYRYAQFATVCTPPQCGDQQPTRHIADLFHVAGLSLSFYSAVMGTVEALFAATFMVFAILIFWSRSNTVIGLLTTILFATFAVTQTDGDALGSALPLLAIPTNLVQSGSFVVLVCFLYLFPDGRFAPRWSGWLVMAWAPIFVTITFMSPDYTLLPLFGFLIFSLFAQVYRYRRVSTLLQRQQTKWVMFAVIVALLGSVGIVLASNLFHFDQFFGAWGLVIFNSLLYLLGALIPISIGFSISRFRLWDLDRLVNLALVYGLLSAILATIFIGVILGLETLADALLGANGLGSAALVISTLLIAALFQPLRSRLQALIDQRFYRRKYDAARTLQTFASTLRNEIELSDLSANLVATVEETMQPAQLSLWLHRIPDHISQHDRRQEIPMEGGQVEQGL